MQRVVKVKFRNSSRFYYFSALDFEIHKGDSVIVDTARGNILGEAVSDPEEIDESRLVAPLKPVIRLAEDEDIRMQEYYRSKEPEAYAICQKKIEERGLAMKLVDVEYAFNGSKLTFYFTADNRVDFRELLKDLTSIFKTRIDLRQIGDRDEAKKCGGLGFCGRPICCSTFLSEFTPVSIKMAKTQNLSLNPIKISGICGKLMCCLRYEQESYESMQKLMPRAGKEYRTPDGVGIVLENNVISETTKLKVTLADGTFDVRSYPFRDLEPVTRPAPSEGGEDSGESSGAADGSFEPGDGPEAPDNTDGSGAAASQPDGDDTEQPPVPPAAGKTANFRCQGCKDCAEARPEPGAKGDQPAPLPRDGEPKPPQGQQRKPHYRGSWNGPSGRGKSYHPQKRDGKPKQVY